jgi:hypothetical protein
MRAFVLYAGCSARYFVVPLTLTPVLMALTTCLEVELMAISTPPYELPAEWPEQ